MTTRITTFLSALCFSVAALGLCSAGGAGNSPRSVTLAFVRALLALDFDGAAALGTDDTRKFVGQMRTFFEQMGTPPDVARQALYKELDPKKIKITCRTEGERAECSICCNEFGESGEKPLVLLRQGKRWLVDVRKEEPR